MGKDRLGAQKFLFKVFRIKTQGVVKLRVPRFSDFQPLQQRLVTGAIKGAA